LQWGGISESFAEFSLHFVLGRQIDLLEKLRTDGNTACCMNLSQGSIGVMVVVKMLMVALNH
jgi:hypothetical protein